MKFADRLSFERVVLGGHRRVDQILATVLRHHGAGFGGAQQAEQEQQRGKSATE
jgi:hypothetical protein